MISRIFENESIVAVDKPHAWLTTPAREASDPRPVLGRKLQEEIGAQIFPVHRLDFEVSGLVLFAKTAEAHRVAQGWFERGEIHKTYEALSLGERNVGDWVEWRSRLVRGKRRTFEAPHGQDALTRARIVASAAGRARWHLMPLTGRSHQLRFEMAKHLAPIIGDVLYGGSVASDFPDGAIALRAVKLTLPEERLGMPAELAVSGFA